MNREQALKLLDLQPDASPDDIKKSYRKLAKALHPDAGGTNGMFSLLGEAYEALTKPGTAEHSATQTQAQQTTRQTQQTRTQTPPKTRPPLTLTQMALLPNFIIPPNSSEQLFLRNLPVAVTFGEYAYTLTPEQCLLYKIKYQLRGELHIRLWANRKDRWLRKEPATDITQPLIFTLNQASDGPSRLEKTVTMRNFKKGYIKLTLSAYGSQAETHQVLREDDQRPLTVGPITVLPKGIYPPLMDLTLNFE